MDWWLSLTTGISGAAIVGVGAYYKMRALKHEAREHEAQIQLRLEQERDKNRLEVERKEIENEQLRQAAELDHERAKSKIDYERWQRISDDFEKLHEATRDSERRCLQENTQLRVENTQLRVAVARIEGHLKLSPLLPPGPNLPPCPNENFGT